MNSRKVEQALKEILEEKGEAINSNHSAFKAAMFDLLDEIHYPEERLVLKHAMDANTFWALLGSGQLSADGAQRAAEQLAKESYMAREDAEFVVGCIGAVRRKNDPVNPVSDEADLEMEVKMKCQKAVSQRGILKLYPDKMTFTAMKNREKTNVSYKDIEKCKKNYLDVLWYLPLLLEIGLMIVCLLYLNYYHYDWHARAGFQLISDETAVIIGAICIPVLILLNLLRGFPVIITIHDKRKYKLRFGNRKKQRLLYCELRRRLKRLQ